MVKVLALDLSSRTGWALFEDGQLKSYGAIELAKTVSEFGKYPWSLVKAIEEQAHAIATKVFELGPDQIVIEETNLGYNRYSQKFLEFLHLAVLREIGHAEDWENGPYEVNYISSSVWRKALSIGLSSEDRRNNSKLSREKSKAKRLGKKLDKAALGIRGKINKKHVALRFVNERFGFDLKVKNNDEADAICLGLAYLVGAEVCDGK